MSKIYWTNGNFDQNFYFWSTKSCHLMFYTSHVQRRMVLHAARYNIKCPPPPARVFRHMFFMVLKLCYLNLSELFHSNLTVQFQLFWLELGLFLNCQKDENNNLVDHVSEFKNSTSCIHTNLKMENEKIVFKHEFFNTNLIIETLNFILQHRCCVFWPANGCFSKCLSWF